MSWACGVLLCALSAHIPARSFGAEQQHKMVKAFAPACAKLPSCSAQKAAMSPPHPVPASAP